MATAVVLHTCSSVLRGVSRSLEQSVSSSGSQIPNSWSLRYLKTTSRAGRKECYAEIMAVRMAKAVAALDGRSRVGVDDPKEAVELVIIPRSILMEMPPQNHRQRQPTPPPSPPQDQKKQEVEKDDDKEEKEDDKQQGREQEASEEFVFDAEGRLVDRKLVTLTQRADKQKGKADSAKIVTFSEDRGRHIKPILPQEDAKEENKAEEERRQESFVGKGYQRPKRFSVSQGRRVQTLAGYTAMIVMYTRTARYKEAERMIEEMDFHGVVPDKANWLARLSAYGQQGKIRDAEKVFRGLQESGISADDVAFNSMILFYGKARMYDKAYATLREMIEIGGSPDESTYRSMIGACGRAGKLKDALQLLTEMQALKFRPSVQNYNTLITLYGKARSAAGILRTIQDMKDNGCKPDSHTLDASLRAMERAGKLLKTLDALLRHLRNAGWFPDSASYGPLLNVYLKSHKLTEALEIFRLMRKENLVPKEGLCRELISKCKGAGKLAETAYVISEVETVNMTPSIETVCTMINALGLMEKVQEAERLYNRLRSSGVKLDIVVYNVMINVYMRVGSHQDATRIFETVEQQPDVCPDSYTYHGMLRVYQKAEQPQEAVEMYWKIVHSGIELDEEMLNCIINCCGRPLPIEETSRLFEAMLDAGFSPNVVTFNVMIDIYGKAGLLNRAFEVFNIAKEHGKVDKVTYSTLINFYGKQRDFANMETKAWEMQTMNLGFWVEAYNSMLDAYGKAGLLSQMDDVLQRMQKAGCLGDICTYNILVNIYGKKGLMEDLKNVLERMEEEGMKPDLWTYNTLIGTYGQADVPDKAMSVFKEMQEEGLMPDRITYKNLVAAFEKSGNLWEAARWSLWMTQAGHAMDTSSSLV